MLLTQMGVLGQIPNGEFLILPSEIVMKIMSYWRPPIEFAYLYEMQIYAMVRNINLEQAAYSGKLRRLFEILYMQRKCFRERVRGICKYELMEIPPNLDIMTVYIPFLINLSGKLTEALFGDHGSELMHHMEDCVEIYERTRQQKIQANNRYADEFYRNMFVTPE